MRFRYLVLLLLCLWLSGCGGNSSSTNAVAPVPNPTATDTSTPAPDDSPTPEPPASTAKIVLQQVLARSVPSEITDYRFTGFNEANETVFGPVTVAKAREVTLSEVPVAVKALQIEYLQGSTTFAVATIQVSLQVGDTIVVEDPPLVRLDEIRALHIRLGVFLTPQDQATVRATADYGPLDRVQTIDVTGLCSWQVDDPTVARLLGPGRIEGLTVGQTDIRATLNALSAQNQIVVREASLVSLVYRRLLGTPTAGFPFDFLLFATFADGFEADVTQQAVWSSLDTKKLTIEASSGRSRPLLAGQTVVRAVLGNLTADFTLPVQALDPAAYLVSWQVYSGPPYSDSLVVDLDQDDFLEQLGLTSTSLFLYQGSGIVQSPSAHPLPAGTWVCLASGDVNGDGKPEVVLADDAQGQVLVLDAGLDQLQLLSGFGRPAAVLALDLDQDGYCDVLVGDALGRSLRVLKGSSQGLTSGDTLILGKAPDRLWEADLDGDGLGDVLAHYPGGMASLRRSAAGALTGLTLSTLPANAVEVAPGDLDGDGRTDLVVATPNSLQAYQGGGTGSFTGAPAVPVAGELTGVVAGDLNLDGHVDVITVEAGATSADNFQARFRAGDGTLTPGSPVDLKSFFDNSESRVSRPRLVNLNPARESALELTLLGQTNPILVLGYSSGPMQAIWAPAGR